MDYIKGMLQVQLDELNESIAAIEAHDKLKTLKQLKASRDEILAAMALVDRETAKKTPK